MIRWAKLILVTLFLSLSALAMATLAVLLMDQPEFDNIVHVCWFCCVVFLTIAIANVFEPE